MDVAIEREAEFLLTTAHATVELKDHKQSDSANDAPVKAMSGGDLKR
jgi:hypothetical protein